MAESISEILQLNLRDRGVMDLETVPSAFQENVMELFCGENAQTVARRPIAGYAAPERITSSSPAGIIEGARSGSWRENADGRR